MYDWSIVKLVGSLVVKFWVLPSSFLIAPVMDVSEIFTTVSGSIFASVTAVWNSV